MEHKAILVLFVLGFCIIFLSSIIFVLGQAVQRNAEISRSYRGTPLEGYADELDKANLMTAFARIFAVCGAFPLALASAIGVWIMEDKYVKLGMLIFSALVTTFILAPSALSLSI